MKLVDRLPLVIPKDTHKKVRTQFPKEYCPEHDEDTVHYNGKCLRCVYGE